MHENRYSRAGAEITIRLDTGVANRLLLALEHLDQQHGLEPVLADLRETVRSALSTSDSGTA